VSLLALLASGTSDPIYSLYSNAMPNRHLVILHAGPGQEYATINAAVAAASASISGEHRALIKVWPGTYTEQVGAAPRVDIAGSTGDPGDVIIQHTCPTGFSPVNTNGGPIWIGGVTAKVLTYPSRTGSGVYGVHHRGEGVSIFERVLFDQADSIGAIGMDGGSGSSTWLIDCEDLNSDGHTDLTTNMHGTGSNSEPLMLVFDGFKSNGRGVNYNSLGSGQADQFYVQGGSVARVNVQGSGCVAHIDPAIPDVASGAGVVLLRDSALPERPHRGA